MEPRDLERTGTALYAFHSGAPSEEQYGRALAELEARLNERLERMGAEPVRLEREEVPPRTAPRNPQKLVAAYGEALAEEAAEEERLVALDADLYLDTGLIPFRERFPERFVECGIAEMDMVSQAGALALSGLHPGRPLVRLLPRAARERADLQQRHRAHEGDLRRLAGRHRPRRPGALAPVRPRHRADGLAPGRGADRAGHRRRGARGGALGGARGDRARSTSGSSRCRGSCPSSPSRWSELEPGRGRVVREGSAGFFVTTGPVMLSQAWLAAERLAADGAEFGVVALPWLRGVDGAWLNEVTGGAPLVHARQPLPRGRAGRRRARRASPGSGSR